MAPRRLRGYPANREDSVSRVAGRSGFDQGWRIVANPARRSQVQTGNGRLELEPFSGFTRFFLFRTGLPNPPWERDRRIVRSRLEGYNPASGGATATGAEGPAR